MDTWGDSKTTPLADVNRVREAMLSIPTYAERMQDLRVLDDLLCDLYAYVDDQRARKSGEEHDEIEPEDWRATPEEDRLLGRIYKELTRIDPGKAEPTLTE